MPPILPTIPPHGSGGDIGALHAIELRDRLGGLTHQYHLAA
jgi:hypothetical protein